MAISLPRCEPFGRPDHEPLPADYRTDPLAFLPRALELTPRELELAEQYERGDFSGGYREGQIALFRRGPSRSNHERRRERLRRILPALQARRLQLPSSLLELLSRDELFNRLRHNTIWVDVPEELIPWPEDPSYTIYGLMREGQGCGYWQLLFAPDGTHVVTTADYEYGFPSGFPDGYRPSPDEARLFQCADSFEEFLVRYCQEIYAQDEHWRSA